VESLSLVYRCGTLAHSACREDRVAALRPSEFGQEWWGPNEVERRSDGKIEPSKIFWSGQLGAAYRGQVTCRKTVLELASFAQPSTARKESWPME